MWSTAATGLPVHSTTTSMFGSATSFCQSSVIQVAPVLSASADELAALCSGFQPTRARLPRAASGARSAMPTICTPGVRTTWARYIAPNLPAPINPTRTGWLSAARCCSLV